MLIHEFTNAYKTRLRERDQALGVLFDNHVERIRQAITSLKPHVMFRFTDIEKEWDPLGFGPYDVVNRLREHLREQGIPVDARADHLYVYGWAS